jgi:hypothetical protein
MSGLRIDANFTEDTVGFALESFLSILSFPTLRFSIEPFSRGRERWLGADARLLGEINGFRPFYMQFKRPTAYPDYSSAKIVVERKKLHLPVMPRSLFFELRAKQPQHSNFQHNIMYRLRNRLHSRNLGDATYVRPLFLDRSAYRFHMHLAGLRRWPSFRRHYPWELEDILLQHGGGMIKFDRIPVLAEHISIPPHQEVIDAKHSYSFTELGGDLCFHSPEALPEGASSLAAFLNSVANGFPNDDRKIRPERAAEELRLLIGSDSEQEFLPDAAALLRNDDPISSWMEFGYMLNRTYGIEQFALINWKD